MLTAGIDCGARTTKSIILKDGKIIGMGAVPTGSDQETAVKASLETALEAAGVTRDELQKIGVTGSGKKTVKSADMEVNDIQAMAKGAIYFYPDARTVMDVGAEEGRAARVDDEGNVVDFAINERCAAGAGTYIEAMARALNVGLEEMGELALKSGKRIPMNAQCVIFAESEVVGLIHAKTDKSDISRAIHDAIGGRIVSMIRKVGVNEDVAMLGGTARNPGLVDALKRELRMEHLCIPGAPEFGAAVGAAVMAAEEA